jgi:hypothetical protein
LIARDQTLAASMTAIGFAHSLNFLEIVCAFVAGKCSEGWGNCGADGFDRACGSLVQQVLELGEYLLDQVQVRRIFGQGNELGVSK